MTIFHSEKLAFRPRARLLLQLGDQLIRDPGIAVFELVKNAYDADATNVSVEMFDVDNLDEGLIVVEDDGCGMSWDIVKNVWLEPGTEYRKKQKESGWKSPKFGRTPLGEKGIGRFAAHKLGALISLITKQEDDNEVVVTIDWEDFDHEGYLSDTPIKVISRKPVIFTEGRTGTRIEVTKLHEAWTRGMVRDVHRAVTAVSSPFKGPSDFRAGFSITPQKQWVEGLLDLKKVMGMSIYQVACRFKDDQITYAYRFTPPVGMDQVSGRVVKNTVSCLNLINNPEIPEGTRERLGDFSMRLRMFDLDSHVLSFGVSDKKGLREFMRQNGGMRVYRDGIRIYDYGEPGNDWLELDSMRVNRPSMKLSNNLIVGAVHLNGRKSAHLREKTNREGFVEDEYFDLFKELVADAIKQVEFERNKDKERIREAYSSKKLREPVLDELTELRQAIKKHGLESQLWPYLDQIEKQFQEVKDRLLTAAGSGLMVSVVIHEVEKGIAEIVKAVEKKADISELQRLAQHLSELIEGLTYLTRKSGRKTEKCSVIIKQAIFNTGYRMRAHNIEMVNGIEQGDEDFEVKCTRRLIIATLMNLIDNSIYWLDNKGHQNKRIYLGTTRDIPGGPALICADNGPGFSDPYEFLVQPFMGRKKDGMGLGLHIASEVMKAHEGRLLFPAHGDVELPEGFDSAVVALQFKGKG